jgi:hypothetical protein
MSLPTAQELYSVPGKYAILLDLTGHIMEGENTMEDKKPYIDCSYVRRFGAEIEINALDGRSKPVLKAHYQTAYTSSET